MTTNAGVNARYKEDLYPVDGGAQGAATVEVTVEVP